jgi:hypothetical protein
VGVYPYVFRIASRAFLWQYGRQHPVLSFLEYLTIAFRGPLVRAVMGCWSVGRSVDSLGGYTCTADSILIGTLITHLPTHPTRHAQDALAYMPKDPIVHLYRALKRWWRRQQHHHHQQHAEEALEVGKKEENEKGEEEEEEGVVRLTLLGKARPLPFFTDQPTRTMAEKRIFVSTFNMAECPLDALGGAAAIASWVPLGADLYVIGVQECMAYQGLGEALLAHVNSVAGGAEGEGEETYMMYSKAIGSTKKALGYHGLIGLWVLAKTKVGEGGGAREVNGVHWLGEEGKEMNRVMGDMFAAALSRPFVYST